MISEKAIFGILYFGPILGFLIWLPLFAWKEAKKNERLNREEAKYWAYLSNGGASQSHSQ